ncbi:hypothetical protein A3K24_02895 [candidate division Kazan bacterium RIFCSPHIGHO2_01_FULL_44_14]|uniref:HTH cro/C1-type domain-containing protein n=1 Tax=candidate division Kazan bacterium RIFCSPLOWO2_01_FULL_45_19 TaxID=1798538 RepID=A0A1F4NQK9_UNCK3|nr:hypothetical protein [uncultured bacterium]OGB73753.1 MAG: hypothetical protein A3K51_02895 [candidate division Kazan bacterium RIFCSPLOWO2_01_FULL_45_19]OGB77998.1 MAG: hypothetical protein A3K24_02895 [candidate division Kazan bacterium RIFCSPHIGHO2_01_FULL_44_14]
MNSQIYSKEYKELVKKLRQARLDVGLTQKEVAQKLGKPQSFVSKVEAGQRRLDVLELKTLAVIYRQDIKKFFYAK